MDRERLTDGSQTGLTHYNVTSSPYAANDQHPGAMPTSAPPRTLPNASAGPRRLLGGGDDLGKNHEADRSPPAAAKGLEAALVFGPDAGLVQERAEKLLKTVMLDLNGVPSTPSTSARRRWPIPAPVLDEAAAISMLGGRRVIRVRGAGNGLADLLKSFLEGHAGDALVVVEPATSPSRRPCANCSKAIAKPPQFLLCQFRPQMCPMWGECAPWALRWRLARWRKPSPSRAATAA